MQNYDNIKIDHNGRYGKKFCWQASEACRNLEAIEAEITTKGVQAWPYGRDIMDRERASGRQSISKIEAFQGKCLKKVKIKLKKSMS